MSELSRLGRSCVRCRSGKVPCSAAKSGGGPCSLCTRLGVVCDFHPPTRREPVPGEVRNRTRTHRGRRRRDRTDDFPVPEPAGLRTASDPEAIDLPSTGLLNLAALSDPFPPNSFARGSWDLDGILRFYQAPPELDSDPRASDAVANPVERDRQCSPVLWVGESGQVATHVVNYPRETIEPKLAPFAKLANFNPISVPGAFDLPDLSSLDLPSIPPNLPSLAALSDPFPPEPVVPTPQAVSPVNYPGGSRVTPVCETAEVELASFDCYNLTQQISSMRQVDKGGYSLVYRGTRVPKSLDSRTRTNSQFAVDPEYIQEVAVKVLHAVSNPEAKQWKRLKREIRVWSCLSHPNLVPLLGYVDGDNGLGFVSPWYPEGNVINFIKKHPSSSRDLICIDVAAGLEYLHSRNPPIVHGDIKGQNILIASDGRASICDFGLSRILDDNPTGFTSTVVGMTLRFSAPELLDGGEKTMETDVYAYGCTCIEILLGKPPYEDIRSDMALMKAVASGTPPISHEQLKECNSCLPLHILNQCWSSGPRERPGTEELAKTFRDAFGL